MFILSNVLLWNSTPPATYWFPEYYRSFGRGRDLVVMFTGLTKCFASLWRLCQNRLIPWKKLNDNSKGRKRRARRVWYHLTYLLSACEIKYHFTLESYTFWTSVIFTSMLLTRTDELGMVISVALACGRRQRSTDSSLASFLTCWIRGLTILLHMILSMETHVYHARIHVKIKCNISAYY